MKFVIVAVLWLALIAPIRAAAAFAGWMETYFERADQVRLGDFWERTVARGALEKSPESRQILVGFFGAAWRAQPEVLRTKIKSLAEFSQTQKDDLAIIVWLSDSDYSRELLRREGLREMAGRRVPEIGSRAIIGPGDAKFLMGWFYATGDSEALRPLVTCVRLTDWSIAEEKADSCASALVVLCEQHERARLVVKAELKRPDLSDKAREIFLYALKKRANQPPEPTALSVTPRADARVAPASTVAHL